MEIGSLYNVFLRIRNLEIISEENFNEILSSYEITIEQFEKYKENDSDFFTNVSNKIFKKENKSYHTISSKESFNHLLLNKDVRQTNKIEETLLVYEPLNDHSRSDLGIGDILFSYRNGQFNNLDTALRTRGIYGVGIALTNPIRIHNEHHGRDDYKNYGVVIFYPFKLEHHLSVRDIQLNPTTINLTPYNGNRNDSLQYIPSRFHYEHLLGMILEKNPFIKDFLNFMDIDIKKQIIPDDLWDISNKNVSENKKLRGVNKIFFGAPGTGKSFNIKKFIRNNGISSYKDKEDHPNVFRITLHPEFSYTDFVGQVMPVVTPLEEDNSATKIEYKFNPEIFTNALKFSFDNPDEPVFLILEEMSRSNIAAVVGDLFQLLDRDVNGESEYRIDNKLIANEIWKYEPNRKIYIPSNLFIVGTVNTSDQNVFVMDTAFKRRFELEYVDANKLALDEEGIPLNNFIFRFSDNKNDPAEFEISWIDLYRKLNNFITNQGDNGLGLTEDKQLGQFFIKFRDDDEHYNYNQFNGKLLEYLWNDVQKVSYSELSIFHEEISNFSKAYNMVKEHKNIFSVEFTEYIRKEE